MVKLLFYFVDDVLYSSNGIYLFPIDRDFTQYFGSKMFYPFISFKHYYLLLEKSCREFITTS